MLLTFTREAVSGSDSGFAPAADSSYSAEAIILPAPRQPNLGFEQNALIQNDYRKLIVAGKDATGEPAPGDETTFESKTWRIEGVTRLAPDGGPVIIYTLWLRRSASR